MTKDLIWLDDIRNPFDKKWFDVWSKLGKFDRVIWVQNYKQFINWFSEHVDNTIHICFDHDIASFHDEQEFTGYDAAKYVIEYCMDNNKPLPGYSCHSDNGPGKENILSLLNNFKNFQNNNKL